MNPFTLQNRLMPMPGFEYQAPDINRLAAPIQQGMDAYQKQQNERFDQGLRSEQLSLQQRASGRADESHAMAMEKQRVEQIAGLAQMADAEQDPNKRQMIWGKIVGSHPQFGTALQKHGIDPRDSVNGPKFIVAQARGYVDPITEAQKKADLAVKEAHARYYDTVAGSKQHQIMPSNRLGLNEVGQLVMSQSAPNTRSEVKGVEQFAPDTATRTLAFADQKATQRFAQAMDDHKIIMDEIGAKPKVGHIWARNQDGTIYQKKMVEIEDKSINPQVIDRSIENLRDSFKVLVGGVDDKGSIKGDGPLMITQGLSKASGGRISPEIAQAYKSTEHAIMNLSYALSGKSIGQAEQKRILDMYMPNISDRPEMKAFKINSAHSLFNNLAAARKRGASDDQLAGMFESAISRASASVPGRTGYDAFKQDVKPQSSVGGWSIKRVD